MFGCTVDLDLSEYFSDIRKYSCIYLDFKECKQIRDAENHIKQLFNINENICLVKTKYLSNDVCLFPSSENIRLLQSVNSTLKVKVLPTQPFLQMSRGSENVDALLPVITVKHENSDYKMEENELQVQNDENCINDFDEINQSGYDTLCLEIVEDSCKKRKDKDSSEAIRIVCGSSVQTDLTSPESISLTELNDEFFVVDDQSDNRQCEKNNIFSNSYKSKDGKNMSPVPYVVDLYMSEDNVSDYEIVCTNKSATLNTSEQKKSRKHKSMSEVEELNIHTDKEIPHNGSGAFENTICGNNTSKKVKCKKKKPKLNISNYTNTFSEMTSLESNTSRITQNSNCEADPTSFHETEIKNKRKRKKKSDFGYEENTIVDCKFYGSDANQIEKPDDYLLSRYKLTQGIYTVNCNNGTILSKQRKSNQEINSCTTDAPESNEKRKLYSIGQAASNYTIKTNSTLCHDPSSVQTENHANKSDEQLKTKHNFGENLSDLNVLKNNLVEQVNQKLMQLNNEENKTELLYESQRNYSNISSVKKFIDSNSCFADSEKSSVMSSMHTAFPDSNGFSVEKKRKRKRKHKKKAKAEKLAAAAKSLAPEDFPKPKLIPVANIPRTNTHRFFSDDDFIHPAEPRTSLNCTSKNDSEVCDSPNTSHNSDNALQSSKEDSVKVCKVNSPQQQSEYIDQNLTCNKLAYILDQSLASIMKKNKADKKVLVFEYKKPSNRNVCTDNKEHNRITEERKIPVPNDETQSQAIIDSNNSGHFKCEKKVRDDSVSDNKNEIEKVNSSSDTIDVTNYKRISSAREGDTILFKMLRLSSDYQPELSKHIIAKVITITTNGPSSEVLSLCVLKGVEEFKKPEGKFSVEETEKTECEEFLELQWTELIEPRLFYP